MKDKVSTSFCRGHERHEDHGDKGIVVGPLILLVKVSSLDKRQWPKAAADGGEGGEVSRLG